MNSHLLQFFLIVLVLSLGACTPKPAASSEQAQATISPVRAQAAESEAPLVSTQKVEAAPAQETPAPAAVQAAPTAEVEPYVQTVGSFLAIDEIGLGPEGYVSFTNFTNVPTTTKGLYLCQGQECFALPDAVIEPGATGRVAVGEGKDLEGVIANKATIGELKPSDGEVALFASDKFDDPKALLAYLQWGSTPHDLTQLAVDAGLWIETGYAPTSEKATRLYRVEESGWWLFEE